MAPRKRKKPVKKVKFQVTRSGIAGIAVVCFCIFLWMFLIGVWAGQSLLYPPVNDTKSSPEVSDSGKGKQVFEVIQLEADKKKKIIQK
ncbi:hypothetical protein UWK_02657 [Desulfocapsa sulfexigens DSM 10523]|uniref:Uncharacterized protein n=1 Tax=Desulfocapsa sulfexigens (strain DSM 10523 / SB164P1) TaxID=1167006 RepID=M1P6V1_DESSD|nr:hypothetical protein [Desulfocapsa sulfexigens]AGF79193.1 hypothetical protein UWK_02657 [Desulfocapsa sulfexigens DSM 10523]